MKPIKIDLQENKLVELINKLNKPKWNPVFIAFVIFIIILPVGGYTLGKKLAFKKKNNIEVIKIAEFKEITPKAEPIKTEKESENKTENKNEPPKLIKILIYSEPEEIFKKLCKNVKEKQIKKTIIFNRIIAFKTKNKRTAHIIAKKLKEEDPSLDPWMIKEENLWLVIAGSYSNEENVKEAIKFLIKHGYKPSIQKIEKTKIKKAFVCEIEENKLPQLEKLLRKMGINYSPWESLSRGNGR